MDENQRKTLLKTAKMAVEGAVKKVPTEKPVTDDPVLNAYCGCFVTLKNNEDLRGCIGNFIADKPLIEMVAEMAVSSARYDSRFAGNRIRSAELPQLDIEISVLSPMEKTEDPMSLELGRHGIYITDGVRAGCFLPQVAEETGWTKEQFLDFCCAHKAGLRAGAWKNNPKVEVYLFTAEVFGAAWKEI